MVHNVLKLDRFQPKPQHLAKRTFIPTSSNIKCVTHSFGPFRFMKKIFHDSYIYITYIYPHLSHSFPSISTSCFQPFQPLKKTHISVQAEAFAGDLHRELAASNHDPMMMACIGARRGINGLRPRSFSKKGVPWDRKMSLGRHQQRWVPSRAPTFG